MPRTITMDEAQQDLENVLQWAKEHNEGVILEQAGKPEGVLMGYDEYAEFVKLRKQDSRRKTLEILEKIRQEGEALNQDLSDEEIYRLAGFGEEVIRETIEYDKKLARQE